MTQVKIHKGYVKVGDRRASMLSGAVHYWRLHPNSWRPILQAIKDMGLETVETYICWDFHEIEKDVFDFTGKTDSRRNLVGFMELVKEMGFWIVLRPGPFIYSEWMHMGVPQDVAKYHRMHPEFTKRAAIYIREVCRVIAPFQATRDGGNFIMLQPDNETDPFEYCYEEQLGLGNKTGMFQDFLKKKYVGDITKLNTRWGTSLKTFEEAHAIMANLDLEPDYFNRYMDFQDFREDYVNHCVKYYVDEYKKNGVDVPQFTNIYDTFGVHDGVALSKVIDLVGMDAYPSNEFPSKTFATGDEMGHRRLNEIFRYLRTFSETAYLAEYEAGIAHGLHYYTGITGPNHYIMTGLTAIQAGMHAWNWYMLVNRDNWMMSPINEWGRKQRELFRVYAEIVEMYKHMDVPSLEKLTDTSLFFHKKHQSVKGAHSNPISVATYNASVDYELWNVETGKMAKPLLLYSGANWLARTSQDALLKYVEDGGKAVFFNVLPLYDEEMKKCNLLGLVRPDRSPDEPFLDHLATETEIEIGGCKARTRAPFFVYDNKTPGEPIYGERVDCDIRDTDFEENKYLRSLIIGHRYQVGYHEKRGKGSITVLGVRPTAEFIMAIHSFLGVKITIISRNSMVKPALFRGEKSYFAVLLNMADYPVEAPLDISMDLLGKSEYRAVSLRKSIKVNDSELNQGRLYVSLPRKDGTIVEISRR